MNLKQLGDKLLRCQNGSGSNPLWLNNDGGDILKEEVLGPVHIIDTVNYPELAGRLMAYQELDNGKVKLLDINDEINEKQEHACRGYLRNNSKGIEEKVIFME